MTRMMKIKIIVGSVMMLMGVLSFFLWENFWSEEHQNNQENTTGIVLKETETVEQLQREPAQEVPEEKIPEALPLPASFLISDVPFTVQAPLAQWNDPIFQDACEEASIIMAEAWVNGEMLTGEGVTNEVKKLVKFEKEQFGQAVDTSITDTAWMLDQYYGVTGEVHTDISITDIQQALVQHRIVIVPTDGRKLKNPNFKQPGPTRHMVVIIGYNQQTKELITNDPGTRKGEGYRYPEMVLYDAILDYATGDHIPVTSTAKVMLTVGKN